MDVEFENDPFGDIDSVPANRLNTNQNRGNNNATKKLKNNRGQASEITRNDRPIIELNANLACPIQSLSPYSNKW